MCIHRRKKHYFVLIRRLGGIKSHIPVTVIRRPA